MHMLVSPAIGGTAEQELPLQQNVRLFQGGWMGWDDLPGGSQQLLCKAQGEMGQFGVIPAPQGGPRVYPRVGVCRELCPGVPALLLCPGSRGGPAGLGSVPGAARSCLSHPKCDPNP